MKTAARCFARSVDQANAGSEFDFPLFICYISGEKTYFAAESALQAG